MKDNSCWLGPPEEGTMPTSCAGEAHSACVELKERPERGPKLPTRHAKTAEEEKPDPETLSTEPPSTETDDGDTEVTDRGAEYSKGGPKDAASEGTENATCTSAAPSDADGGDSHRARTPDTYTPNVEEAPKEHTTDPGRKPDPDANTTKPPSAEPETGDSADTEEEGEDASAAEEPTPSASEYKNAWEGAHDDRAPE